MILRNILPTLELIERLEQTEAVRAIRAELISAPYMDIVHCGECKYYERYMTGNREYGRCRYRAELEVESTGYCNKGEKKA